MFEWLFEMINPGPVGDLSTHKNVRNRTRLSAILTGIPAVVIAFTPITIIYYVNRSTDPKLSNHLWTAILLEISYLLIAYFLKPEPDDSNLGWLRGIFDNPFRISDDFNRFLLFLLLALLPGRLVGIGLVDFAKAMVPSRLWHQQSKSDSES